MGDTTKPRPLRPPLRTRQRTYAALSALQRRQRCVTARRGSAAAEQLLRSSSACASKQARAQAEARASAPIDRLNDVDQLLLLVERPIDFVVVARAQINHDVLRKRTRQRRSASVRRAEACAARVKLRCACESSSCAAAAARLVAEEEHEGAGVEELIHGVEIRHLSCVERAQSNA